MNQKHPHKVANVGKDAKKSEALYTVDGNVNLVWPPWKAVWAFLQKLKIKLSYDLAILLWDMYAKESKARSWRDICTPMFIIQRS